MKAWKDFFEGIAAKSEEKEFLNESLKNWTYLWRIKKDYLEALLQVPLKEYKKNTISGKIPEEISKNSS